LDKKSPLEPGCFPIFFIKRTQAEADHEYSKKKRDPLVEIAIECLEGKNEENLGNNGGKTQNSQGCQIKKGSFLLQAEKEEQQNAYDQGQIEQPEGACAGKSAE
jgi:hypothetical protein